MCIRDRRLYGHRGRQGRGLLPGPRRPGAGQEGAHRRGAGRRRRARHAAAHVHRERRRAVWLLRAGHAHVGQGALDGRPAPDGRGHPSGLGRQPVPLHRLHDHRRRGPGGERAAGARQWREGRLMPSAELLMPGGLRELTVALQRATPSSRLLAGGTDLIRSMHRDHWEPDLLIDLSGVRELDFVRLETGTLRIGSMTTFAELQADPLVRRHARCLAEAAAQVGSAQIRNVATVGGNIANASPCADSVTALVALGAEVRTIDGGGRSALRPLEQIVLGSGRTSLAPDEAITEVSFAAPSAAKLTSFAKIGSRSTVTVARLSMALVVKYDAGAGTVSEARVGLGAVGEAAFR